jgi:hypothetical protein
MVLLTSLRFIITICGSSLDFEFLERVVDEILVLEIILTQFAAVPVLELPDVVYRAIRSLEPYLKDFLEGFEIFNCSCIPDRII